MSSHTERKGTSALSTNYQPNVKILNSLAVLIVTAYGITIVASAMAGGYLPQLVRMNHFRMQLILSFVGGMMLGIALLHLLVHGYIEILESGGRADPIASLRSVLISLLAGLLVTFFLMRIFHFHQHGEELEGDHAHTEPCHHHQDPHSEKSKLGWIGVMLGLGLHTFMDGVALGAVVKNDLDPHHGHATWLPAGFGVYLAILLHKPLDALSIASLMTADKRSGNTIRAATAGFGLMAMLGGFVGIFLGNLGGDVLGYLLAASAGIFICISLSDLLPEVQFHRHDRIPLSMALLVGIGLAVLLESFHQHHH